MLFLSTKKRHNSEKTLNLLFFSQDKCMQRANITVMAKSKTTTSHFTFHSLLFIDIPFLQETTRPKGMFNEDQATKRRV